MKRVLLLSTGGTIACMPTAHGLAPRMGAEEILARVPWVRSLCQITCRTIFSLDSANIQPEEWETIAREVTWQLPDHDGIVILHGTDTMAYTASMLSFMLGRLDRPVILTGSQLPIAASGSDAPDNLTDAIRTAMSDIKGVHIVFDHQIIQGTRAVKLRTVSRNAFESINKLPVGWIEQGQVMLAEKAGSSGWSGAFESPEAAEAQRSPESSRPVKPFQDAVSISPEPDVRMDPNVFLLKLIPGTRPDIFDRILEMGYAGVVVEGFGLGGIPDIRRNIAEKLRQLVSAGVAVVLTTQCPYEKSDLAVYEVGWQVMLAGIIPGMDMTSETAVTKLMWVLGHTRDLEDVRRMMLTSYFGEIDGSAQVRAASLQMA